MRTYKQVIREAELLNLPLKDVSDALKARSQLPERELRDDSIDDEAEGKLLEKNEPLITLALARYGRSIKHVASIFDSAPRNSALSLACLSNRSISEAIFSPFPLALFGNEWKMRQWLMGASEQEFAALFQNPGLRDEFLEDFLGLDKGWDELSHDALRKALLHLSANPRMSTQRDDSWLDGFSEYQYAAVFNAAWELSEKLPPTEENAAALGHLYAKLVTDGFNVGDPLEVAKRWHPNPNDAEAIAREQRAGGYGRLGRFQLIRCGLAKLALSRDSSLIPTLLVSDDAAFRIAAYSVADLTTEHIQRASEKDDSTAFYEMLQNPRLWRTSKQRRALKDAAWRIVNADKQSDLLPVNAFNARAEAMEKSHPGYFEDDAADEVNSPEPEASPELQELERQGLMLRAMSKAPEALTSKVNWALGLAAGAFLMTLFKQ